MSSLVDGYVFPVCIGAMRRSPRVEAVGRFFTEDAKPWLQCAGYKRVQLVFVELEMTIETRRGEVPKRC